MSSSANTPLVVGIVGGSGAGKTTFAARLREWLAGDAVVIAHDNYYKDLPDIAFSEQTGYDFDTPDALDTPLLVEHLRALAAGHPIEIPTYDFATHTQCDKTIHIEPAGVVVLEGLFIMCDPALRGLLDLTVFIDVDEGIRAQRRLTRDVATRGISMEDAQRMYLATVKPAHERYVEPCKARADIVIDDAMSDDAVGLVAEHIGKLRARRS